MTEKAARKRTPRRPKAPRPHAAAEAIALEALMLWASGAYADDEAVAAELNRNAEAGGIVWAARDVRKWREEDHPQPWGVFRDMVRVRARRAALAGAVEISTSRRTKDRQAIEATKAAVLRTLRDITTPDANGHIRTPRPSETATLANALANVVDVGRRVGGRAKE